MYMRVTCLYYVFASSKTAPSSMNWYFGILHAGICVQFCKLSFLQQVTSYYVGQYLGTSILKPTSVTI